MKGIAKRTFIPPFSVFLIAASALYLANAAAVRESVREALLLCGHALVPSLFPILVFSRLLAGNRRGGETEGGRSLFKNLAFGWVFGFPVGAMLMSEAVDATEEPRIAPLLYLSCGTSATFVVSFVGLSLLKDIRLGIALYLAQLLSLLLLSLPALCRAKSASWRDLSLQEPHLPLAEAIRLAAFDMLAICGCVVFFGSVADLVAVYLPEDAMQYLLPWIEVSCAVSRLSRVQTLRARLLLGFAVGFGGASAILQMLPFVKKAGGTALGLILARCKAGILTALFFFLFSLCAPS